MKLEPLFTVSNNQLLNISDNSFVDTKIIAIKDILWSKVELQEESYNEEFLAELRTELKNLESTNKSVIINPIPDKNLTTEIEIELFINTCNHTARRIKDCISMAGFIIPKDILKNGIKAASKAETFIETLSKKHSHYIFFAKKEDLQDLSLLEEVKSTSIVVL